MNYLNDLNKDQLSAVECVDGPVLIIAGPGTGKTKTLTTRIARIIDSKKARPFEILALTFTKKAAEEMSQWIGQLLSGNELPQITTFHALCYEVLGKQDTNFISNTERLELIKRLDRPSSLKHFSVRELALEISRAKNSINFLDEPLKSVVETYNLELKQHNQSDFDDLLLQAYDLLKNDQTKKQQINKKFKYILVDEFQDTNRLQYELLRLVLGNKNLFVIGDPKQSIYGFRGASGDIFDQFKKDFTQHKAIALQINYRSAKAIVNLANSVFDNSDTVRANSSHKGHAQAVQTLNPYSEAAWVLGHIEAGVGGSDLLKSVSDSQASQTLRDFAILYRSRSAGLVMQKTMNDSGLPYQIVGEGSPYEQPQIQNIISLIRAKQNNEASQVKDLKLAQAQAILKNMPDSLDPNQLAEHIISVFGYETTKELKQFLSTLHRFKNTDQFLQYIDQIAAQNFYDPAADSITLLTIHAAKGLEFTHVFLIGCEEGVLPHSKADINEEKRLFYVAVTRAKQELDILYTKNRASKPVHASRFVADLSDLILPKIIDSNLQKDQIRAQKRSIKKRQTSLF